MGTVALDSLRSCLHAKKTRNSGGFERVLGTTRLNSVSTSTKSPSLSNTSWIDEIFPWESISSNSKGPFQDSLGSDGCNESGACAVKVVMDDCETQLEEGGCDEF